MPRARISTSRSPSSRRTSRAPRRPTSRRGRGSWRLRWRPAVRSRTTTASAGIVRRARRPAGWRAPGPRPATPDDRPDLWPRMGEDLCHLAGDWRILQLVRGHRWSLDDLVTAWFGAELLRETPPGRFADLG